QFRQQSMRIFSGMAHRAGKAGASVLFVFKQNSCTRITQKQPESLGFQGVLCYSVRIISAAHTA
ncbi:MAG: hypothetical protein J6L24_06690, partial [Oscillospiraceae bacterium]|nr:hypothetical protein [Oscillospiraceae bacterium]